MHLQVTFTCGNEQEARKIAAALVEARLAACVQVSGPIHSTYRWQGKIEEDQEWITFAKTTEDRYAELETKILELHSYDNPEVIATPIVAGSAQYLKWLEAELDG